MKIKNALSALFISGLAFSFYGTARAQSGSLQPFQKIKAVPEKFQAVSIAEIQPGGWLKRQLRENMNGFTGRLDSLAPDLIINDDIYGTARLTKDVKNKKVGAISDEGDWQAQFLWWNSETQSNWRDGYIRTAILLNDKAQLQKAGAYVNRILATQDSDGYLGIYDKNLRYRFDNENGELWSKATLLRGLLAWYDFKKDPKILTAIHRAVDNVMAYYPADGSHPFYSIKPDVGGVTHGLVFTDVLEKMYQYTGSQKYLDYCLFLYKDFSLQNLNEDAQYKKLTDPGITLKGHGVHTYEHLRSAAAAYYASGNPALKKSLDMFLEKISKTINPSGGPGGDEFISGKTADASSLGYEYCSLLELMDGYIDLLKKTGDASYADKAEKLFFNAAQGARYPTGSAICYLKTDNAYYLTGGKNGDTTDRTQTRYRYSPAHKEAAVCCVPNAGKIAPSYRGCLVEIDVFLPKKRMNKLPVSVSISDFEAYILPHLSHKVDHNRQRVSYHYIFNTILYILKSGCSWRTLKPDNQLVTWQNIYYHYTKWAKDGSFLRLFEVSRSDIEKKLALECLQLDGTHTPSKKGAKK